MKIIKKALLSICFLAFIAANVTILLDVERNDLSLDKIINSALAQSELGTDPNKYYSSNPFSKSGKSTDKYGVTWCYTHTGDWCDKIGDNCPNGIKDSYNAIKC